MTVLAATIISPALPRMAEAFANVPNAEFFVRLTLTMPALFIAIGALFAGLLLDRFGRKPVLIISTILYGLAGTAGFFLDTLPAILVSRAILGVAVAGVMSGFTTLILDYFKGDDLNKFLGLNGAFIGLGGMVFLLLAGLLAEFGWRYPFLVHAFAFVILLGIFLFIDEPDRITNESLTDVNTSPFSWGKLAPVYLTAFVGMAIFFIFPVQIPFHLADASTSRVGLALSLQTLASVIAALQYQRLRTRYSFLVLFSLIFLAFSLNLFVISFSPAYLIVVGGLLIGGVGVGLFAPNNSGWLAAIAPPELRGKAVGGMTSALFLGQFASPFIAEPLVSQNGLSATFAVAGAASLLIMLIFAVSAAGQRQATAPALKSNV